MIRLICGQHQRVKDYLTELSVTLQMKDVNNVMYIDTDNSFDAIWVAHDSPYQEYCQEHIMYKRITYVMDLWKALETSRLVIANCQSLIISNLPLLFKNIHELDREAILQLIIKEVKALKTPCIIGGAYDRSTKDVCRMLLILSENIIEV